MLDGPSTCDGHSGEQPEPQKERGGCVIDSQGDSAPRTASQPLSRRRPVFASGRDTGLAAPHRARKDVRYLELNLPLEAIATRPAGPLGATPTAMKRIALATNPTARMRGR